MPNLHAQMDFEMVYFNAKLQIFIHFSSPKITMYFKYRVKKMNSLKMNSDLQVLLLNIR